MHETDNHRQFGNREQATFPIDTLTNDVDLQILYRSIASGIVSISPDGRIKVDMRISPKTIQPLKTEAYSQASKITWLPEVVPPPDFDWEGEAKKALRETIRIIDNSGLVDKDILVDAGKIAGPGNIKIVEGDTVAASLDPRRYELSVAVSHGGRISPMPVPPSKDVRDRFIALTVDKNLMVLYARSIVQSMQLADIRTNDTQTLQIALFSALAHEYGHALLHALEANNEDTLQKIIRHNNEAGKWGTLEDLRKEDEDIHTEHFARGISAFVMRTAFRDLFGLSEDLIHTYFSVTAQHQENWLAAVKSMLDLGEEKGFLLEDVIEADELLKKKIGRGKDPDMVARTGFRPALEYWLPPYSPEELFIMCFR